MQLLKYINMDSWIFYFVVQIILALATGNCMVYVFPIFLSSPFSIHVQQIFIECLLCTIACANHIGSTCSLVYKCRMKRKNETQGYRELQDLNISIF